MFDIEAITSPKPTDCGATCLKMLLAYYGVDVPLAQLVNDCNTRISGCTAKDILVAGRLHGLNDMIAFKMDADELIRQDRPAIIWWRFNHWVVFDGVDDEGKVVICNPDKGRYRMSKGTFTSFYTDISLWNGEPHDIDEVETA